MAEQHKQGSGHGGHGGDGTMGVHGMLLFGEDALYLSHLPMFQSPHNFQVILEAGFDDAAAQVLRADRETSGQDLYYTFEPAKFHITELDPGGDGPARSSIEGTIYRGHFERGGQPIARRGCRGPQGRVLQRARRRGGPHGGPEADLYLLRACRATALRASDYGQPGLRPGARGTIGPRHGDGPGRTPCGRGRDGRLRPGRTGGIRGRRDTPQFRLSPQEIAEGSFFATIAPKGFHGFRVQVEVDRELYVELRELGSS